MALRPAEPVEVWIGASAPPAIDRAARLAEGWIASPGLTPAEARSQADFYRERCAAYGREPKAVALRASRLPGNLLGDGSVVYRAVALSPIVTRDAASGTLVGATSLSLFIGNKRARKPSHDLVRPHERAQ